MTVPVVPVTVPVVPSCLSPLFVPVVHAFVLRCSMGSANCRRARQPTEILTPAYGSSGSKLKTGNRFRSTTNRKYSQGGESDVLY